MKTRRLAPMLIVLSVLGANTALGQGAIILIRHADRASSADDSLLSKAGEQRAQCLATTLKDASIGAVFATDVKRTQQTAAPVAAEFHIETRIIPKANTAELLAELKQSSAKSVLVVGHADTLPDIVQRLGAGSIPRFGEREYDRMILVPMVNGEAQPAITLHYCSGSTDAAGIDRTMR